MFDVSWKPKDFEKINKSSNVGGYHHYSISNYEDVEGFCEYLKYKGCTDIKIIERKEYSRENVKETRDKYGLITTETDLRNVDIVKKCFNCECEDGNIPLTFRHLIDLVKENNVDIDKPIIIESDGMYALEHIYVMSDCDDYKELNDCLVIDLNG